MPKTYRYFSLYKPFGMLSQFTAEGEHPGLSSLNFNFPRDVYPLGRLDADSEGLLLLTNDPSVNFRLLDPRFAHQRTYWVQVEGAITDEACRLLEEGVVIRTGGKPWKTASAEVRRIEPPLLPERHPPVRFRKSVPDSWISLTITEGKNRQVRKMTAVAGFPTLRLVRVRIGDMLLEERTPGSVTEWPAQSFLCKIGL